MSVQTPLLAHSDLFKELVKEADIAWFRSSSRGSNKLLHLQIDDMPGGAEAFEMASRFCYNDSDITITSANVAMLRCASEFLQMTEFECNGNLMRRTEDYLRTTVFWSWEESLSVLRSCEEFQQAAEKSQIVQRCASSIADKAFSPASFAAELQSSPLHAATDAYLASYLVSTPSGNSSHRSSKAANETWWFDDLSTLSVHLMESVVRQIMINRACDHKVLAKFLLHYLRSALPVLGYSAASLSPMKLHQALSDEESQINQNEKVQREVVEIVVNLLANLERKSVSCRSLLGLRRIAVALRAGKHCRRELERMIGRQLEKATLDNILIPALPPRSSSLYDVDLVLRLVDFFLKEKAEALFLTSKVKRSDSSVSVFSARTDSRLSSLSRTESRMFIPRTVSPEISAPVQGALTKVGELMDKYLAEIAADTYLKASKFLALAELLPDYARQSDDGLYRAVDIYLEVCWQISRTRNWLVPCSNLNRVKLSCFSSFDSLRLSSYYGQQAFCNHLLKGKINDLVISADYLFVPFRRHTLMSVRLMLQGYLKSSTTTSWGRRYARPQLRTHGFRPASRFKLLSFNKVS